MQPKDRDLDLLRTLCRCETAEHARRIADQLRGHVWTSGEHEIVFEACARLARRGSKIRKDNVAREVTLAGFPDVDLDAFFESSEPAVDAPERKTVSPRRQGKTR